MKLTPEPDLPLARREEQPLAVARPVPTVGEMLHAVINQGVTGESVAAVKELVQLYREVQKDDAAKAFAQAFVALQAEMPKVKATKAIPSNDGTVRSRFAPYEEIMAQVGPLLQAHGFTVTFSMDYKEARLIQTCTLQHVGGHERSNSFAVRVGSGPPKASEAQADGAAATFAKRYALCSALNIVVDVDTDARVEGAPITAEQAASLRARAKAAGFVEAAFLKFAGAATFEQILSAKLAVLEDELRKREAADPKKALTSKLWDALVSVRGAESSWATATAWLRGKKILGATQRVSDLTVEELKEAIDKTQIELTQT